jgi:pimeloyl-ACP methyl ester carboxylesterase
VKILQTAIVLVATLQASMVFAQQPVSYQGLDADFYPADGDTAVLLLHGTLAHNRMDIIETISTFVSEDYGYPVLAPNLSYDLPGREGMLDCGITHTHKHFDALSEITHWVDYLEAEGYQKILVSAHSRGGAQMSAYLANSPAASIMGSVLIAPATFDAEMHAASYEDRFGVPLDGLMQQARTMAADDIMEVPGFVYCEQAKVAASSFIDYYTPDPRLDTPTNLTKITNIPVAVVAGSDDGVVPELPSRMETTDGLGDHISLEVIDGSDHFFRDLYADDVSLIIVDMIEATE